MRHRLWRDETSNVRKVAAAAATAVDGGDNDGNTAIISNPPFFVVTVRSFTGESFVRGCAGIDVQ